MAQPGPHPTPAAADRPRDATAPAAEAARPGLNLPLLLVLLAALALRLWHLGARPIWTDEGSTWTAASARLPELIRLCAHKDASPPLFYLLTSLALRLGDGEWQLRLVSALASVGLVWLTYRLARLAMRRSHATLAALLCAVSPFQLMFAQEARTYTTVAFFTVLALHLFARAFLLGRTRAWMPFVLASTAALYTQGIALLGTGVQGALILLTAAGRRRIVSWGAAQALAFLLHAPWIVVSLMQASRMHSSHWYLEQPGRHELFIVIRAVFLSPIPLVTPHPGAPWPGLGAFLPDPLAQGLLLAIPLVPLFASLVWLRDPGRTGLLVRFSLAAFVLPLVAVWIASYRVPLWLPRYFVFLTPFLAVLWARGLMSLGPRALRIGWTALVIAGALYACLRYDTDYTKERWRAASQRIVDASSGGRTAALVPFDLDAFRYYNNRHGHPVAAFEVSHPEVPFASDYTPQQLAWMEQRALRQTASYDDVWVVVRSANSEIRREVVRRAQRVAATGRSRIFEERLDSVGGPLRLEHYRRPAPVPPPESAVPVPAPSGR